MTCSNVWQLKPTICTSPSHNQQHTPVATISGDIYNIGMIHQLPPHMDLTTFVHPAESGLTFNTPFSTPPLQPLAKKSRHHNRSPEIDAVSPYFHHHQMEIDRLISDHMERLRAEVWRTRTGLLRQIAAAVEGRLKAKEDEIEQVRLLNAALEERVRELSVENQAWKDVAHSSEATAQALRCDLEAALLQQQLSRVDGPDEESCCDNEMGDGREDGRGLRGACRVCRSAEATVLVLPCRHLCLCAACSAGAQECALCGCSKQCTVHVNLSSSS